MFQNIEISKIFPHPDNPRKDLGDLSELAESIKANGILQNLTVVPQLAMNSGYCTSCNRYNRAIGKCGSGCDKSEKLSCSKWVVRDDFMFTTIIGHRRLAAAKLAGLTEVPCSISNMKPRQQISTMLLENMQRSDLTIYEQAQGFQMLLDLGDSVSDISKQTGFSETTVRSRAKLLKFDKDKFRQSVERGGTLMDYAELDKIHDADARNSVLEHIGTSNFQWKLKQAIDSEKQEKIKAALIAQIETFATRVTKTDGLRQVKWLSIYSEANITTPEDFGETKYFFTDNGEYLTLYKEASGDDPCNSAGQSNEERRQIQERRQQLDSIHKLSYELRGEFVKNYSGRQKDIHTIMKLAFETIIKGDIGYCDASKSICNVLGIEITKPEDDDECDDDEIMAEAAVSEAFNASPEKVLLVAAYCGMDDAGEKYCNRRGEFQANPVLSSLYDGLEKLGYEISEEEQSLRNGTHKLFISAEEK